MKVRIFYNCLTLFLTPLYNLIDQSLFFQALNFTETNKNCSVIEIIWMQ